MAVQSVPVVASCADESILHRATISLRVIDQTRTYALSAGLLYNEIDIPQKISRYPLSQIDLSYIFIPFYEDIYINNDEPIVLNIAEGVEVVNKHRSGITTGIPATTLVYATGEREELFCDDYQEAEEYTKNILSADRMRTSPFSKNILSGK